MENTPKKYGKLLCFAPLASYTLWSIYFLISNRGPIETSSVSNHLRWMTETLSNYNNLLWPFILCAVITTVVLLYFVVHLARIRRMDAGTKIAWMVFMVTFGAFSFPVFYFMELRGEPDDIQVYPDIA